MPTNPNSGSSDRWTPSEAMIARASDLMFPGSRQPSSRRLFDTIVDAWCDTPELREQYIHDAKFHAEIYKSATAAVDVMRLLGYKHESEFAVELAAGKAAQLTVRAMVDSNGGEMVVLRTSLMDPPDTLWVDENFDTVGSIRYRTERSQKEETDGDQGERGGEPEDPEGQSPSHPTTG